MTRFVRERFPDREAEILNHYVRETEFRGLCHDFGVCVEQIERLAVTDPSEGTIQRLGQFHDLKRELELEIVEYLNAALTKPRP